jgi:glutathione S-transferase
MITVWGRTNSINVQKVLWTLAELGLEYRRIDAGLKFGVVETPGYLAMNPNALVPTLDDDGLVLWESNVIVRYLASRYGAGKLCPADLGQRFSAERWMDWQATSLGPVIGPIFYQLIRVRPELRDVAQVEKLRPQAERWLTILDAQLATRPYVNGDDFTMADIPVGTAASRWYKLPLEREVHAGIEAWLGRLRERPGFRAHVDQPLN